MPITIYLLEKLCVEEKFFFLSYLIVLENKINDFFLLCFFFVSCTIFNMQLTAKCIYIKMYQIQNLFWNASQQKKNPWYHLINSSIYLLFPNNNLFTKKRVHSITCTNWWQTLSDRWDDGRLTFLFGTADILHPSKSIDVTVQQHWEAVNPHVLSLAVCGGPVPPLLVRVALIVLVVEVAVLRN